MEREERLRELAGSGVTCSDLLGRTLPPVDELANAFYWLIASAPKL